MVTNRGDAGHPVIVICAGGHAKVLIDLLRSRQMKILGITDADPPKKGTRILGEIVIGTDEEILRHSNRDISLINGLGSVKSGEKRQQLFEKYSKLGYRFETLVHPSAILARDVVLGEGVQVMAGVVIQTGSKLGLNSIINTGAIVDHDCIIGNHVHVAPGATLCGGVSIGDTSHIGASATVLQYLKVGAGATVGAMSLVTKDLPDGIVAVGAPALVRK